MTLSSHTTRSLLAQESWALVMLNATVDAKAAVVRPRSSTKITMAHNLNAVSPVRAQ